MWTCLYLSHIVVIIMIVIAILGIIYEISQKKLKAYQVIVVFVFCIISMALVSGVTAMNWINNEKIQTEEKLYSGKYDYWTCDTTKFATLVSDNIDFAKYVDLETGNIVAVKNEAIRTNNTKVDLSNEDEAKQVYDDINIKEEFNLSDDYLITVNSKKFVKLSDNLYYITYLYEYDKDDVTEKGKIYLIADKEYQMKTYVMTNLINDSGEKEFTENVLELIGTMNL